MGLKFKLFIILIFFAPTLTKISKILGFENTLKGCRFAMQVSIDNNIVSARVFKKSPLRRGIVTVVIVALYLFSLPYCYYTSGAYSYSQS